MSAGHEAVQQLRQVHRSVAKSFLRVEDHGHPLGASGEIVGVHSPRVAGERFQFRSKGPPGDPTGGDEGDAFAGAHRSGRSGNGWPGWPPQHCARPPFDSGAGDVVGDSLSLSRVRHGDVVDAIHFGQRRKFTLVETKTALPWRGNLEKNIGQYCDRFRMFQNLHCDCSESTVCQRPKRGSMSLAVLMCVYVVLVPIQYEPCEFVWTNIIIIEYKWIYIKWYIYIVWYCNIYIYCMIL